MKVEITQELIDKHLARACDAFECIIFHALKDAGLDVANVGFYRTEIDGALYTFPAEATEWQRAIWNRAADDDAWENLPSGDRRIDVNKLTVKPQPFSFDLDITV